MTLHTPGDWILEDGNFVYALNQHNINRFSCHIQGGYTDQGTRTPKEELAANARLIAACPDLLTAASHALAICEAEAELRGDNDTDDYSGGAARPVAHMLRAAINKAEGRP